MISLLLYVGFSITAFTSALVIGAKARNLRRNNVEQMG